MAETKKPTGMIMDGVFSSEAVDSSGEVVSLKGMDVTTMEEGYGVANYEHLGDDGNYGREIVGRVIYVHKIFKESDCEDARQRKYWAELKSIPFLYGVVRLYDGAGHEGAKALAAQVRDAEANNEPVIVRYSIEGTTLEKKGNRIESSLAKRVALTLKPCNRTCVSGIIADPNAPEGFGKAEVDPDFAPLGGAVELECSPMVKDEDGGVHLRIMSAALTASMLRKTLEAGIGGTAPSAATGGASLQREYIAGIVGNAKAALRDWGTKRKFDKAEFIGFAKARMPEASDEFLDHFAEAAEHLSLRKAQGAAKKPPKTSLKAAPGPAPLPREAVAPVESKHAVLEDISDEDEDLPDEILPAPKPKKGKPKKGSGGGKRRNLAFGTFRGTPLTPNRGMVRPHFDPETGMLHTPVGSFRAYLPEHDGPEAHDSYTKLLGDSAIEGPMDHALTNWMKAHKVLKAGKLPPEVMMHAVMFSQLSPTKPVPVQEIQFARLHDAMDATGIDPREPGFGDILKPWQGLDSPDHPPHLARESFLKNPAYYQGGKIGVERDAEGQKVGNASEETGRYPGEFLSVSPLANDFMARAKEYHKLHGKMMDLATRHRHDALSAVNELMEMKQQRQNQNNVRRAAIKKGKPDPGEPTAQAVPGLKVKTGLYTWGMLGGGNSVVPDTHFVRNMFGLDLNHDSDTIEYLKQMLWRPTNMKRIMNPLNQWYLKNHPAAQYTLNHPKWGKEFEKPEDALFPSFWRHWLTIAPHEKSLGLANYTQQAGTDHAPYWEAIMPHIETELEKLQKQKKLKKTEDGFDSSVPMRTAQVHQQYVRDYGEIPALLLYHTFLMPKLLEAAEHREKFGQGMAFLEKARQIEEGVIELRKSVREVLEGAPADAPDVHQVHLKASGRLHPAGRFMVHDGQITHLEDYHGLLHGMLPEGPISATTASRLHGLKFAPHFQVSPHHPETPQQPTSDATLNGLQISQVAPPLRPPVFEYQRPGMRSPHVVEFGEHGAAIDGRKLDDAELELILGNVESGIGTLRYRPEGGPTAAHFDDLAKDEDDDDRSDAWHIARNAEEEARLKRQPFLPGMQPAQPAPGAALDPGDALQHVRAAVAAGHIHPDVERALTKHIYTDPMVQDVGNKYAWQKFSAQNRPGVYASIDLNDFKHINDTHGHQAGDDAIRAAGGALRAAADKVGTGKLFRSGGDEFVAHFPTMEEASRFARHTRAHFDALPPVAGVHKQSFSMGLGSDFHSADAVALHAAKARKIDPRTGARAFAPGRVPHLVHSAVPGASGPLAVHDERPAPQHLPAATPTP